MVPPAKTDASSLADLSVLIVDDMAAQRAALRDLLSLLGVRRIEAAGSPQTALQTLRSSTYDLVMCDLHLQGRTDGQQLLEHAREQGLLPPHTLFFIVSADSSFRAVAASGEGRPDAYLVKPVTASSLEERLRAHLERSRVLPPIQRQLDGGDVEGALAACDRLIEEQGRWLMSALQLKAQALQRLGRHAESAQVCHQALGLRPGLVWARVTLSRALQCSGDLTGAMAVAEETIRSEEGRFSAEAYDILALCLESVGDGEAALRTLREAAQLLPSHRRLRRLAECAVRQGDAQTAKTSYQQLIRATQGSVVAQELDTLTLSQVRVDLGEAREVLPELEARARRASHGDTRRGVALAIKAQAHARLGEHRAAEAALSRARREAEAPGMNLGTLALAKAELLAGEEARGLELLEAAGRHDPSDPLSEHVIARVLRDTGREPPPRPELEREWTVVRLSRARSLFKDERLEDAVEALITLMDQRPEDPEVLLQTARLISVAVRLTRDAAGGWVERVQRCLDRLDRLRPGDAAVERVRQYSARTLEALAAGQPLSAEEDKEP